MTFTFNSEPQVCPYTLPFLLDTTDDEIKNEPMFFSASYQFAWENGGPLTREFLNRLSTYFFTKDLIIDSRSHMLMPNFWPCIPGWHHDDVPRGASGQPNYKNPEYRAKHCMMLVNGDIAPTEFAIGQSEFEDVYDGEKYYKIWHKEVEHQIANGKLQSFSAPSNKLIYFDWQTWHRGTKAVKFGWRWFIRATINTGRKHKNETRQQVQVYVDLEDEGW